MHIDFSSFSSIHSSDHLLLFFHGWGGDSAMLAHLQKSMQYDVMQISDYRDFTLSHATREHIKAYHNITVVAWSFGVWVAQLICHREHIIPQRGIAYNGTLHPIDDERGIPTTIAHNTLKLLNPSSLEKFRRRMMGSSNAYSLLGESSTTRRDFQSLHDELSSLYQAFNNPLDTEYSVFDHAVIGNSDYIIPANAQRHAWQNDKVAISEIESPHFCFYHYDNWDQLC